MRRMTDEDGFRITRIPVAAEPLLRGLSHDYADSYEVQLEEPDAHSAEEWVRTALEQSPAALRRLIPVVHRHLLRFRLSDASDAGHVMGWRVVASTPDVLHLETAG